MLEAGCNFVYSEGRNVFMVGSMPDWIYWSKDMYCTQPPEQPETKKLARTARAPAICVLVTVIFLVRCLSK